MSYQSIVAMTSSSSLEGRIAACAADEGLPTDPLQWARQQMWDVVSADAGWVQAWDYARAADNAADFNPDTGARSDVIDDEMILAVVQPMVLAAIAEPEPPT